MKNRIKYGIFAVLVVCQILITRYKLGFKISIDLLYLILVYISVKSNYFKTLVYANIIGLITDCISAGTFGIFGFSRVISAFLLNQTSKFVDYRKNIYIFIMIYFSLLVSNGIANLFLYLILDLKASLSLIGIQPLVTAVVGLLIIAPKKMKIYLDVY